MWTERGYKCSSLSERIQLKEDGCFTKASESERVWAMSEWGDL